MKLALAALGLVLVVAIAASVPLDPYKDFQVLFHANLGLLNGISLYDQAGQTAMIARFAGVRADQVYVLPFPYPPWYALSTIWLARLPVDSAARVWFGLNLLMLVGAVAFLTGGQPPVRRALVFLGALFWLPALGSLFVGQYGFPVLLGAALMVHALEHKKPWLVALAAALLTFKPHLGLALILLAVAQLLYRRDRFARDAGLWLLVAGAMLFGLGFLASPRWPSDYIRSLMSFQGVHGVPQCTQCVGLPAVLSEALGGGLNLAAWIASALAFAAVAWLIWRWQKAAAHPMRFVSIGALATLLVSPYLLNYDYLLLLGPLIMLQRRTRSPGEWIALGAAYILPVGALVLWGTAGNPSLIFSSGIVLALTLRTLRDHEAEQVPAAA